MLSEVAKDEDSCTYYTLTLEDIRNCDISKWHQEFMDVTVPTLSLEMGPELIKYLTGSFRQRRQGSTTLGNLGNIHMNDAWRFDLEHLEQLSLADLDSDDDSEDMPTEVIDLEDVHEVFNEEYDAANTENLYTPPQGVLIETINKITASISDLGGSVIPKLNWVAPKDVTFMGVKRSMKCQSSGEIFLLLKLSDRTAELANEGLNKYISNVPSISPLEFQLVLRKWIDSLSLEVEFRCFVCDGRLTGTFIPICQRDTKVGYYTVVDQRDGIIKDIHDLFCTSIHSRFPAKFYVFDVARLSPGKAILLDFGVFGLPTDPLLFTYRELKMLMEEISCNLKYKTPTSKSESGLQNVVTYGEPYFRYLIPDHSVRSVKRRVIAPSDIVTYLREGKNND